MAARKKKSDTVTIIMPVGVDAGNEVEVSPEQAVRIKRGFGEWSGETATPSAVAVDPVVELEKALATSVAKVGKLENSAARETKRADKAEAEVTRLNGELAELTDPDNQDGASGE